MEEFYEGNYMADNIKPNITSNLNYSGIFFELACLEFIEKYESFIPETQAPYTLKPDGLQPIDGTIDFLCLHHELDHPLIYFVIECKKADPSLKDWVFFERNEVEGSVIWYCDVDYKPEIYNPPPPPILEEKICDRGFQVNDSKNTQSFKEPRKDPIYNASRQAYTGFRKIISEQDRCSKSNEEFKVCDPYFYIPVVITTANLYLCDFEPNQLSIETGKASENEVKYKPLKWVEYSFPIPEYLRIEKNLDRQNVLIVNSQYLKAFFGLVARKLKKLWEEQIERRKEGLGEKERK